MLGSRQGTTGPLHHFSDDPAIGCFQPRSPRIPALRPPGLDWLNGPLVWAIDAAHQPLYLFPRDAPRILLWRRAVSSSADVETWMGNTQARMVAFAERAWRDRIAGAVLYRYSLPPGSFEDLDDAGMWVSRAAVTPLACERLHDLPARLEAEQVELRLLDTLLPLKEAWRSSLHVSGIRLRNAAGWRR